MEKIPLQARGVTLRGDRRQRVPLFVPAGPITDLLPSFELGFPLKLTIFKVQSHGAVLLTLKMVAFLALLSVREVDRIGAIRHELAI